MFCEQCGKENAADAKFCEACGAVFAPVENPVPTAETGVPAGGKTSFIEDAKKFFENLLAAVKKSDTVIKIGIAAGAVAVLILLLAVFGVFKPAPVKRLEQMTKAGLRGNAKQYFAVMASPYTEYYSMDKDEKAEEIEEMQEELREEKEDRKDDGVKLSFKDFKVTKKYKKSEVKKISEYIEDRYDYDVDEYKLQAVQIVKFTAVEKEDGDTDTDTEEAVMIKVKNKWYVDARLSSLGKSGIKNAILNADE